MRVVIDTTYSRRAPYSGTAVYVEQLCAEFARGDEVEVLEVANPSRRPPAGGGLGSVRNLLADRRWAGSELPRIADREGADVIHHPLPALARRARAAQVVTVHDLAFERLPGEFDRGFRLYAHRAHRSAALGADAVICVSETTAADVRELWGVPDERIVVARHGPGQALAVPTGERALRVVEKAPQRGLFDHAHFLYVGDDESRKNVPMLLEAYARYRAERLTPAGLVLAGSASATAEGVRIEHQPSRERLAELYAGALALVHPSLYEGFGMTALEAMSAGVPVLAGGARGVRETCGEAALYVDPRSPSSLAEALARLADDVALRDQLAARGRRRAAQFSWADCARAHLDAYSLAGKRE